MAHSFCIVKCVNCGKEVKRWPSQLKNNKFTYCSQKCCIEYRRNHKETLPNPPKRSRVFCDCCGKEMSVKKYKMDNYKHHFCSKECLYKFNSENEIGKCNPNYKNKLIHRICPICGKEFDTYQKTQVYCSTECGNKGKECKVSLKCVQCGKEYSIPQSALKWSKERGCEHNFCSKKCRQSFCVKENNPRWIQDRSLLKERNRDEPYLNDWRKKVFERDDYTCQMCGDRGSKGHKVILNAHHIVKYSVNKELRFVVDNGITLCEKCHLKTYGKEEKFEEMFTQIVNNNKIA